ncbi:MvdC/MvdD family ATP grasp protein [Kibdelosporangium aridum]|uniref:ATP-grasp domain-containing protein n=1 Tax=Kibdelosporangium aridum TaxID=2030 RepID=A0A1W2G035_KIBAR|nr:hypothetical protein [Kibdelosporangium aridum]SMD27483.1 hypothetical protein SAMN05661093_11090 [Kibdelosporangium aridum]
MKTVLVLTNSYDDCHVEAVRKHLIEMGHSLVRLDTDSIIRGDDQFLWDYRSRRKLLVKSNETIQLDKVNSVWFRKPFGFTSTFGFAESIRDPVQRAALQKEVQDVINSVCITLDDRTWLNRPQEMFRARLKPYQLEIAHKVGLLVPDTIITNDPRCALEFCSLGATVFKPIAEPHLEYGDGSYDVDTTLITEQHIDRIDLIRSQPTLLQRYIQKSHELRVTCVGDELFIAKQTLNEASHSDSSVVDWRALQFNGGSSYTAGVLPSEVAAKIRSLLRELDLAFAAIDLAVDRDGNHYFLEVNPNGQWLGYTDEIGLPAAASVAKFLVQE